MWGALNLAGEKSTGDGEILSRCQGRFGETGRHMASAHGITLTV